MALAYEGIERGELELLQLVGIDPRPVQFDRQGRLLHWGDPDLAFVGSPDGWPPKYTGYGVYAPPIAAAAAKAGGTVVASGRGITPDRLYGYVLDGHPAIAWIANTYRREALSTYTSFDGAEVRYTLLEHAVTVVGVRPGEVMINDPWFGPGWRSRAAFEAAYATFDYMAVVLD